MSEKLTPSNSLLDYIAAMPDVKGWCNPLVYTVLWPIRCVIGQGPVAEIGVYEGKFFIGLVHTFANGITTRSLAVDVFDMQEFNVDRSGSGKGRRPTFIGNLSKHGISERSVDVFERDSLSLRNEYSFLNNYRARFVCVSVDGCHEAVHTVNDLQLAMELCAAHGIIVVDDFFNPDWPGVTEAIAKMYLNGAPRFVPLVYVKNKLVLCQYSFHDRYLADLTRAMAEQEVKTKSVNLFGFRSLSTSPDRTHVLRAS